MAMLVTPCLLVVFSELLFSSTPIPYAQSPRVPVLHGVFSLHPFISDTVCHKPENKHLFAPLRVLCNDFQAYCADHGVSVPWALYQQRTRSIKFRSLVEEVFPEAKIANCSRKYRGQDIDKVNFWFGVQLAGDSAANGKAAKGTQSCALKGKGWRERECGWGTAVSR